MLKAEWQDNEAKPEAERVLLEWCSGDLRLHITEGNMHSWLESFDSEQQVVDLEFVHILGVSEGRLRASFIMILNSFGWLGPFLGSPGAL